MHADWKCSLQPARTDGLRSRKEGCDLWPVRRQPSSPLRTSPANRVCRGGLGHFAVFFAKALGAEVYVMSHTADKEKDAKQMGADHFINVNEDDWYKPYNVSLLSPLIHQHRWLTENVSSRLTLS